jgi:SAM-dependent methyltransferase
VIIGSDNLFALPETDALLREELGCVGAHAARRPAGRALVLQACAANRRLGIDTRHLAAVRVHAQQGRLSGDVACAADALPWEDDAFQLVFAQHVSDVLPPTIGMIDELARVLAPGGVLLWCGLNPWSPALVWVHWRGRHGMPVPHATPVESVRRRMSSRQLTSVAADYLGAYWPQHGVNSDRYLARLLAPLRQAYLLTASKQRAVLTPLRPRAARERAMVRPQLVGTPSRRVRA